MTDPIVDAVCAKLQARSAVGLKKYGTTIADSLEDTIAFIVHSQEEAMDLANYLEKLLNRFSYGASPAMEAVKMMDDGNNRRKKEFQEKEMPTPMTIEMDNEMTKDEIEAALNKLEEPLWLNGGRSVPLIIRELLGVKHYETIRAALQSPRVPDAMFKKLGSLIKAVDGGTFENDPHDAIIDAAIRTLSSPRVPVIGGLDEAMSVINKFIRARDAEIDFLPEKSTKNTSEWISHFMHNVNYSLSFNDWMNLDKARAYAELQKGV